MVLLNTPCPDEAEFSTLFDATDLRPKLFSNVWPVKGFASETYDSRFLSRYKLEGKAKAVFEESKAKTLRGVC